MSPQTGQRENKADLHLRQISSIFHNGKSGPRSGVKRRVLQLPKPVASEDGTNFTGPERVGSSGGQPFEVGQ